MWLKLRRARFPRRRFWFLLGQSTLPYSNQYGGGGGVSQSTPPPGGRILPEVHAEPAAAGRLPGRRLPEAVAPEALAADVHKHRGEQGGGDLR